MGMKDEIREAKEIAADMCNNGEEAAAIALRLNGLFDGFYYSNKTSSVFRENVPDYAPPIKIL